MENTLHSNIGKLWKQAFCQHPITGRSGWPVEEVPNLVKDLPLGWAIEYFAEKTYVWSPLICYECGYQEAPTVGA